MFSCSTFLDGYFVICLLVLYRYGRLFTCEWAFCHMYTYVYLLCLNTQVICIHLVGYLSSTCWVNYCLAMLTCGEVPCYVMTCVMSVSSTCHVNFISNSPVEVHLVIIDLINYQLLITCCIIICLWSFYMISSLHYTYILMI